MPISSTQLGTIGENLLINAVLRGSGGRLAPYQPYADDDGVDVLFFDKETGGAVPVQVKSRSVTLFKPKTTIRGDLAHFELRKATFNENRNTFLSAILLEEDLSALRAIWCVPLAELHRYSRSATTKWVMRASVSPKSKDRCTSLRCADENDLAERLITACLG